MTRAERDRLVADQHLIIRLAEGVCESKHNDLASDFDIAVSDLRDIREDAEDAAEAEFERIKDEAEAEIARLEGLEVEE